MNTINWKPKALKQMRKIPTTEGAIIRQRVNVELIDLSEARNVKALTNHQYTYRLRVGRYRVFFDVQGGDVTIVTIEEVKKRDDHTY